VGPELPDLPLLLNQWRTGALELRPVFLRTSEFLWQEANAHATEAEARDYASRSWPTCTLDHARRRLCAVLTAQDHSRALRGATRTWTCEGMMGDGKSLQMGTSHELGQNFAKAFGIQFSDAQGTQQYACRPRGEPPHG